MYMYIKKVNAIENLRVNRARHVAELGSNCMNTRTATENKNWKCMAMYIKKETTREILDYFYTQEL